MSPEEADKADATRLWRARQESAGDPPEPPPGRRASTQPESPSDPPAIPARASALTSPPPGEPGPSFDALAQGRLAGKATPARFSAPPPQSPPPGRGPALRIIVAVLLGAVVLGILGATVWVRLLRNTSTDPEVEVTSSSIAATSSSPQELVRGYLEALAAGDIERALSFGPRAGSGSRALLTPEAYAAMPRQWRPSDITILTLDPAAQMVEASYSIGDQEVSTSFEVTRLDTGALQLAATTATVRFQIAADQQLPMLANGVPIDHTVTHEVVPGLYELTTGLPYVTFPADSEIPVAALMLADGAEFSLTPRLTEDGIAAFTAAARASLDECLGATSVAPDGCPFAVEAPRDVVPGSVRWRAVADPWKSSTPALGPDDMTAASGVVELELEVEMDYTDGTSSGATSVHTSATATAAMVVVHPDDIQVVWQG
ncbi:MAG: hypothetical protein ACK5KO_11335 [Arachnia sp.]